MLCRLCFFSLFLIFLIAGLTNFSSGQNGSFQNNPVFPGWYADPEVATGAGHHSVLNIPGTDDWYIVYHRRPLSETSPHHRVTCIDRMEFDENGLILPVKITFRGVTPRLLTR